jgi:hypothetical protein
MQVFNRPPFGYKIGYLHVRINQKKIQTNEKIKSETELLRNDTNIMIYYKEIEPVVRSTIFASGLMTDTKNGKLDVISKTEIKANDTIILDSGEEVRVVSSASKKTMAGNHILVSVQG